MTSLRELMDSQTRIQGVRANFVANVHGSFIGSTNSSRDLSNSNDLALLKHLRSLSDVIVTDAATARRERYRPSRYAPIQVWSRSGDFTELTAAERFSMHKIGDPVSELSELRNGHQSVLLETGPTLTSILGAAKAVDELKISITGAQGELEALGGANKAISSLHLNYLKLIDHADIEGTHFFTFGR